MRCFLPTTSINRINLYIANIEMHFYYYLIFHISQEHFNKLKSVLFLEKLVIG